MDFFDYRIVPKRGSLVNRIIEISIRQFVFDFSGPLEMEKVLEFC